MPIIENKTSITRPVFMEWRKSSRSAAYKKTVLISAAIMIVLLGGGFLWFWSKGVVPAMMIGEFIFMLAIYCWVVLYLPHSRDKKQYKEMCRVANGTPERTVRFYQNYFSVSTESGKTRDFYYDKVHTLKETEHLYVLVNESDIDIIVNKEGFLTGSMEQVKELLPETCVVAQ